jgi:hypothetical protein
LTDYVFFHGEVGPAPEAVALARRYFAQGHDISFLPVKQWLLDGLATVGNRWRLRFAQHVLESLRGKDIPAGMKLAWNETVREILGSQASAP